MGSLRVSVEWIFGDIVNYFKFLGFRKNLKVKLCCMENVHYLCTFTECTQLLLWSSNIKLFQYIGHLYSSDVYDMLKITTAIV